MLPRTLEAGNFSPPSQTITAQLSASGCKRFMMMVLERGKKIVALFFMLAFCENSSLYRPIMYVLTADERVYALA